VSNALIRREPQIVVSTQVINEVAVNLLKKASYAEDDLRKLITSFYSRYRVIEIDHTSLVRASELRERYTLSFWDSLIIASALASDASIVYSEDMQDGLIVEGRVTIINPLKPIP
jgi:predicted nucleic acid-binding protein